MATDTVNRSTAYVTSGKAATVSRGNLWASFEQSIVIRNNVMRRWAWTWAPARVWESYVGITWLTGHAKPEATGVSVRNTPRDYPGLPQEGRNSFENLQRRDAHCRRTVITILITRDNSLPILVSRNFLNIFSAVYVVLRDSCNYKTKEIKITDLKTFFICTRH